jgi:protein phosphatase-4 regulatory subunit 3
MTEDELHRGDPNGYHRGMEPVSAPPSLPDPPTLQNLEEVADSIAALQHVQQRDQLAMWIANEECRYLKNLLALFPRAEKERDYEKLATLAACVKTILLLNDPSIVELIVTIADLFEKICACLEYDPDLREKANHRWFLRERAKFRTVVPMNDPELVSAIHRSFRVNYLRDTLLRPTMDESCLSSLSSLQTFSHGDIVKGVTLSPDKDASLAESYLMRLIRTLGNELHALCVLEWTELDAHTDNQVIPDYDEAGDNKPDPSIVVGESSAMDGNTWKQYLAPQDSSVQSRRIRRRGCISFLRELFSMVKNSLQQSDKDDFFAVVCGFRVELGDDISDNVSQNSQLVEVGSVASTIKSEPLGTDASSQADLPPPLSPVTLLCLLGNVLCDPNTDLTEKAGALEIIGTVAMHDPSLIRRHCLDQYAQKKGLGVEVGFVGRPKPNESKQVVFQCPENDLLASLIFLLNTAEDAGILLQISEIMRLLLDTDMVGDQGPPNAGFADEAEGFVPHAAHGADHPNPPSASGNLQTQNGSGTTTDQKQFLAMFYENYVEWLVTPFQFQLFFCVCRIPTHVALHPQESALMEKMMATAQVVIRPADPFLRPAAFSAIRSSFAVELLSFCVRAHLYRMKFFMLKSRVLGSVLELLRGPTDRCLKLAALRFLRAILSVNDEFYHRHIIQHDLFCPVFAAFRANPVGDNLVSSAIVEMCDYITTEGIKSLLEYIVTKHLSVVPEHETIPSLEDVSSPYVSTLTVLRKAYEAHKRQQQKERQNNPQQTFKADNDEIRQEQQTDPTDPSSLGVAGSSYFGRNHENNLTGAALEDQRKFREADAEASYFESGGIDDDDSTQDDMLHRTPRMFSFPIQAEDGEQPSTQPVLYGMRHAHSLANELMDKPQNKWGAPTFRDDPSLKDADLSTTGIGQVQALAGLLATTEEKDENKDEDTRTIRDMMDHVDLVVVSPLTRCLQTWEKGCREAFVHGRRSATSMPPVVAHPLATERIYTSSDTGRSIKELQKQFPDVDFSECWSYANTEGENWWYHGGPDDKNTTPPEPEWRPHGEGQLYAVPGEPEHIFEERIQQLQKWLLDRPAKSILLIAHWGVLQCLSGKDVDHCQVVMIDLDRLT